MYQIYKEFVKYSVFFWIKKTPVAKQPGMVPRGGLLIPQPGTLNI